MVTLHPSQFKTKKKFKKKVEHAILLADCSSKERLIDLLKHSRTKKNSRVIATALFMKANGIKPHCKTCNKKTKFYKLNNMIVCNKCFNKFEPFISRDIKEIITVYNDSEILMDLILGLVKKLKNIDDFADPIEDKEYLIKQINKILSSLYSAKSQDK